MSNSDDGDLSNDELENHHFEIDDSFSSKKDEEKIKIDITFTVAKF